jgi:hypothetical protein
MARSVHFAAGLRALGPRIDSVIQTDAALNPGKFDNLHRLLTEERGGTAYVAHGAAATGETEGAAKRDGAAPIIGCAP